VRRSNDFKPGAHPGSLVGSYDQTEAHRRYVLNGNGAEEDPDHNTEDDSQEDGWITL
jgi:hypothetical protein